jgi:hypothetical protein
MFVAEEAPSTGFEIEEAGGLGTQAKPTGGEHAEGVGVGYEEGVAAEFTDLRDDAVHARSDILSGFAAGARLCENSPPRHGLADFCCGEAFVFSVIPLTEVVGLDGCPTPADKIASATGSKAGTA